MANNSPTLAAMLAREELVQRHVYGVPVFVPPSDWEAIDEQIIDKGEWIMAFHRAVYAAVTAHGVKGDPHWDELIRLTDHPKGRASTIARSTLPAYGDGSGRVE